LLLTPVSGEVVSATINSLGQGEPCRQYRIESGTPDLHSAAVVSFEFSAISSAHSAVVWLSPQQILAGQFGGSVITNGAAASGRISVVNSESVLDISPGAPQHLTLFGLPGASYSILSSSNGLSTGWSSITNFMLPDRVIVIPLFNISGSESYYRAREQ